VDRHFAIAGDLVNPRASMGAKLSALVKAGVFYAWWYPTRFLGWSAWPKYAAYGSLARHLRWVGRTSRRLARATFHAMVRFGPALEKRQAVLGRLVDIGAELFVMNAVVARARMLARNGSQRDAAYTLADEHCRRARRRITDRFRALLRNEDKATYVLAKRFLEGDFEWLEDGIVSLDTYRMQLERATSEQAAAEPDAVDEPVTA